jgi:hypothetical protein
MAEQQLRGHPDSRECNNGYRNRETVFSVLSVPRCYKQDSWSNELQARVETGSNTSTVTLRVVGGDEKGSLES